MWIFTQDGFLSVVEHRDDSDCLIVRSRARDDLERMAHFAGQEIIVMPDADYRFRVEVPGQCLELSCVSKLLILIIQTLRGDCMSGIVR